MAVTTMPASIHEVSFPPGSRVCVTEVTSRRAGPVEVRTFGVVEAWEEAPTGSWYAHGKNDRLWLRRLKLKKADGEIAILVVDDGTSVARWDAAGT
jgi:hypothetical protein